MRRGAAPLAAFVFGVIENVEVVLKGTHPRPHFFLLRPRQEPDVFANRQLLEQLVAASPDCHLHHQAGIIIGWQMMAGNRKIRKFIKKLLYHSGLAKIEIERHGPKVRLILSTARPGIIIGRKGVEIEKFRTDLLGLDGVESIHQLKVWAITSKNIHLTVHLFAPKVDRNQLHRAAIEMLLHKHGIVEVTLQIEDDAEMNCQHTHQHVEDEQRTHSHQH